MLDLICNAILWVLAMYGLIEIIKTIYETIKYTKVGLEGTHVIITVKDKEESIEGFMNQVMPRILNDEKSFINNVIIADLNSKDRTKEIISKLNYNNVKITSWDECKEIIEKNI